MADVFTPEKRSKVMSLIRGKGNASTEQRMIKIFREHGIKGWRRNWPLPGKPDFVFPQLRIAVFVDGCFWHRCPKCYHAPATNAEFWDAKIGRNVERDKEVNRELKKRGWRVVRVWEHELKGSGLPRRFKAALPSDYYKARSPPPPSTSARLRCSSPLTIASWTSGDRRVRRRILPT
jgi:DNA mismatch endonuclease (patch repair protein)